uniref:Cilia and flagella associated protein 92 (putative) n=1 Tax=Pavo cristatus TaxID=9049 RepID=A0A8C9FUQ1_PAVCR
MEEGGGEELAEPGTARTESSCGSSERGSSPAEGARQLSSPRTVPCVLTVSLAIPALATSKDLAQMTTNKQGKGVPADELRTKRCYRIEYFLLPDDLVPRKTDLVVFGTVAKLFAESASKTVMPWLENDQIWISWNHNTNVDVTNEFLIKLRDHKITLKLWDIKDKAFSEARLSKSDMSSIEGDAEAVGKSNANRYVSKRTLELDSGAKKDMDTTGANIASLQLDLMPLLSGENSVISRLEEDSPVLLDAYVSFTVETPLLSERQRRELNPLVIKICSATRLPNTPIPIGVLQRLCVPTYCRYKFHNFPAHQTHGQLHGTHVYFKDVNVFLTGMMKPGELQRYLRGPPLEIEVHDRDRKIEDNKKKPHLSGEDQADENLGEVRPLTCKSTVCNSSMENEVWHPHGVAKVSLTDLLLGKKYLTISAAVRSCSTPNTAAFNKEDKSKKIGKKYPQILLPMGHYLQSDSLLKVRVEIAVPLRMHAEIDDAQVTDCPYGCIIYIFDYSNSSLLRDLMEEITEINAKALQLDCYPPHVIRMALATLKLKSTLEKGSELDIITGFHLLDGASHLFVLEGLKDKAIKRLWDRHFERLSYLCHSKRLRDVIQGDLLPSAEMITALSREYGAPLTDEDLFTQKSPLLSFSSDYTPPGNVSREKKAGYSSLDHYNEKYVQWKKEIADKKISPADGKSVYNYSPQSLNSAELAKKHLRQEMAKVPKTRFTYCHEYLSATFDPVDVAAACKESFAKSKSTWLSPDGFVFSGFKSSAESNLHPRMPDEARVEELRENALYANMEPVLPRGRWSWDKRHVDFELYKKPPELPVTAASLTVHQGKGM